MLSHPPPFLRTETNDFVVLLVLCLSPHARFGSLFFQVSQTLQMDLSLDEGSLEIREIS